MLLSQHDDDTLWFGRVPAQTQRPVEPVAIEGRLVTDNLDVWSFLGVFVLDKRRRAVAEINASV